MRAMAVTPGSLEDPARGGSEGLRLLKPAREPGQPVRWYRPRLPRDVLASLNRRSDLLGFAQTLGFLGTLALTGSLFVLACFHAPWLAIPALLVHGACCAFLVNGFHELVHDSVFRTRRLNRFFLRIFSFLGWYNHVEFWASHTEHHKFTLHAPDDLEVVLPQQVTLGEFLKVALFDYMGLRGAVRRTVRFARGGLGSDWERYLFTELKPELRPALRGWSRVVLFGHLGIVTLSVATGYWPVAVAVSFGRFFGNGLQFLCNATQHIGLVDHYPDFRVACRTFTVNPVVQFLYWHMNYHTEHHMFAGVPCYRLGRLHRLVRHELPACPRGLVATWLQISAILRRQKLDPSYQFVPRLPDPVPPTALDEAGSR